MGGDGDGVGEEEGPMLRRGSRPRGHGILRPP